MSHPQDCFCEVCRGEAEEPSPPLLAATSSSAPSTDIDSWDWEWKKTSEEPPEEIKELPQLCADVIGMIRWITSTAKLHAKGETMLPKPTGQQQQQQGGSKGGGGGARMNYLKPEHLTGGDKDATIMGVRYDDQNRFGARILVKVLIDNFTYFWSVNVERNPNYDLLLQNLGQDENSWVKKHITLGLQRDEFSGNMFIRATFEGANAQAPRNTSRSR